MSPTYAWIIDKDHTQPANTMFEITANDIGTMGPRRAPPTLLADLAQGKGVPFRLLDDDETLYYEGRLIDPTGDNPFAPLDDFGEPNAGCTGIQFLNPTTNEWEYL